MASYDITPTPLMVDSEKIKISLKAMRGVFVCQKKSDIRSGKADDYRTLSKT